MSRYIQSPRKSTSSTYTYSLSFLSGLVLSFAFPGRDLAFLGWFALSPFIFLVAVSPRNVAFKAGLFFGIPFFFGTQYWIYYSIHNYGNLNILVSLLIVFVLCAYEALYTGLFGVFVRHISHKSHIPLVLIAPPLWVCLEFARSIVITGFPWSFLGYSQFKLLPLIQISDITGVYGVSFIIVSVNSFIADIFLFNRRRKDTPLYPVMPAFLGALFLLSFLAATVIYGYYHLQKKSTGELLNVSIVQGNFEQDIKWDKKYQESVFSTYLSLTKEASRTKPDLIVWPETSVPFVFGTDAHYTKRITEFQKINEIPLLFGSIMVRSKEGGLNKLTNSAILMDSSGKVLYTYDKIHLVPFGEYVPLRSILFFVDKLVEGVGDYVPGRNFSSARTSFGQFSTVICYELIFPSIVRSFFSEGGDFLVTITNDAWFGNTVGPIQHFYTGVFRAIENRKPIVRAANTGISGFIDSKGRIISKSGLFEQTVLNNNIVKNASMTFYTKYGDIFVYVCLLCIAIVLINLGFHSKRFIRG